ncbi:MAG: polysaccharide deacetylase family protein [Propionibacteriaceae bacterium]
MSSERRVVALIPAYNEEASIAATIEAVLRQERVPDRVVVIPNGCSDQTAEVARSFPVTVLELPRLEHKKSEALNRAWQLYAQDADVVVCLDADTVLPPNAIGDWEQEFVLDEAKQLSAPAAGQRRRRLGAGNAAIRSLPLGGSSSKFTMLGNDFLTRLQRAEFSRWTDTALRRGWTSVLAGTGAAISGEALRRVTALDDREGPWVYTSQVEDFELTYRIRELGYRCQVSPTVRAYTDSMKTVKALWGQRMKWQVGTIEDLIKIGLNPLTRVDWFQQLSGMFSAVARYLWVTVILALCLVGRLNFQWLWWVAVPLFFVVVQIKHALRIPHRDKADVLFAFLIFPSEVFAWLRAGWFTAAWVQAPIDLLRGRHKDRWGLQYRAEAFKRGLLGKLRLAGFRVAGAVAVATVALLSVGNLFPATDLPTVQAVARIGTGAVDHSTPGVCSGYVALTYDDGPTPYTAATSDLLRRYGLHAAFFLTGEHVEKNPDAVRALVADGQMVGNHSVTHPHLLDLPLAAAKREITDNADLIEAVTGARPTLFRPPYGETNDTIAAFALSQDQPETLWTLDTNDWTGKTAYEVDDAIKGAEDGDIILMHDDEDTDIRTVPLIAATLRQHNLCTGRIVADTSSHPIALLDKTEAVKVVAW